MVIVAWVMMMSMMMPMMMVWLLLLCSFEFEMLKNSGI